MLLSVLDQSPIPEGSTAGDALRNSIELAQLADRLGYTRCWVAEHHGTKGLACNSPEVLIGPIAAATSRIRVGSGGIMLPHYSPLKVAESFGMLAALYPGRIDLGIGRAAGTSPKVAFALQRDRRQAAPDDFREQLDELINYLANRTPYRFASPELSLLGSSPDSVSVGGRTRAALRFRRLHQSQRLSRRPLLPADVHALRPPSRAALFRRRLGHLC